MKKFLLTALALLTMLATAQAQQTVRRYLRVSDSNLDLALFGGANSRNLTNNTITLGEAYCAAGWNFDSSPLDLKQYDKLVFKIKSITSDFEVGEDGGSAIQVFLCDNGYWGGAFEYRVMDGQLEFEFDLSQDLYKANDTDLNMSHITHICFWCFAPCTIALNEVYLEKTIAAGLKDYEDEPFAFSSINYTSDGLLPDNDHWTMPLYSFEAFAGWQWSTPQDWSAYQYLVVVPQVPFYSTEPAGTKPMQYSLADDNGNILNNAQFRHFFWNGGRAAVIDLKNFNTIYRQADEEDAPLLKDFDVKKIAALWFVPALGNESEVDFGVSAVYLTNSQPTWSAGFLDMNTVADFLKSNDAADQWSTICLPYNSAICGANAYSVVGADKEQKKLVLKQANGILKAGTPYIIKTNCASNVTFYRAGDGEVGDAGQNGALTGTLLRVKFSEADAAKAVLNAETGKWVAVEADAIATANGAYVDITRLTAVTAGENDVTMDIDADLSGIASGIQIIHNDFSAQGNGIVYDLSGRRITSPAKGIYIKNGRKFVIK